MAFTISDSEMVKERGLTTVTMNHAHFSSESTYESFGLINFNDCLFDDDFAWTLYIRGSKYEPTLNIRTFKSDVSNRPIKFYKSKFNITDHIVLFVYETA